MKLLVLTSRFTANRDIIDEDFGRQIRLFESFKKLGHDITFFVADYKTKESKTLKLHDIDIIIEPFSIFSMFSFKKKLKKIVEQSDFDYCFITSDPLWSFISKGLKMPLIYDIQDDYKLYKSFKLPFVKNSHKRLLKTARLITCASDVLSEDTKKLTDKKIVTIPNCVDFNLFKPIDKIESRKKINLPEDVKIIAYIGSLQRKQGVDLLIETFNEMNLEDAKLILVGKPGQEDKKFNISNKNIISIGSIPYADVPFAINSADVLVIPYPLNQFTRTMQAPYKMVEYMACNVPMVITDVGSLSKTLGNDNFVAKPGDRKSLKEKIKFALKSDRKDIKNRNKIKDFSWDALAKKLEENLKQ